LDALTPLVGDAAAAATARDKVALVAEDASAFLTVGVKAFLQFRPDVADGCEGADSGIYSFVPA